MHQSVAKRRCGYRIDERVHMLQNASDCNSRKLEGELLFCQLLDFGGWAIYEIG